MASRIEIYRDAAEEWRWRRIAANGETIATGEGYERKIDAAAMARQLFPGIQIYEIDVEVKGEPE